jgi:hypothetical protein
MQPDSNGIRLNETNRAFIPIPSRETITGA